MLIKMESVLDESVSPTELRESAVHWDQDYIQLGYAQL